MISNHQSESAKRRKGKGVQLRFSSLCRRKCKSTIILRNKFLLEHPASQKGSWEALGGTPLGSSPPLCSPVRLPVRIKKRSFIACVCCMFVDNTYTYKHNLEGCESNCSHGYSAGITSGVGWGSSKGEGFCFLYRFLSSLAFSQRAYISNTTVIKNPILKNEVEEP